jgi:hypothetical protein
MRDLIGVLDLVVAFAVAVATPVGRVAMGDEGEEVILC